jgi:hypothetical protein
MGRVHVGLKPRLTTAGGIPLHGRLSLTVVRPDGTVRERREGDNVVCTTGYSALAGALVWAGIQDQAANLGVTAATTLTPLWGAVGNGAGTPAESDTALFGEIARQTIGAGAAAPATSGVAAEATWQFYFPQPTTAWTVTEAGAFAGGTSAAGTGAMLDHWAFSPSVSVAVTDSVILQVSLLLGP